MVGGRNGRHIGFCLNPSRSLFDISHAVETPEGVDMQADLAGPVVRSLAFVIDFSIRCLAMFIIMIAALLLGGNVGWAVWLLFYFLVEWWYPVLFETFRGGQTPGKKAMGITVVNDDLTPVTLGGSLIRNLLRAADFLPSFYTFGLISMTMHPQFQRLGDIAAGTLVIHKAAETSAPSLPDTTPAPPPFELHESEQTAVVELSLRHESLTDSRQQELAAIVAETMGKKPDSALNYLRSIGAWLLGSR
ncbi:RDD family protein [Pseudomaricurvus alkylphenolicus]|nr:RDD family protein [Pseudomaricurvus alkylphenolicus]